ncbi:MAG: LOG family protein, partial [Acidimicrobiia bacterium]|nr:LOG family protein [Acidimicrobiia bacterium]
SKDRHRPKVTMYGSARMPPGHPEYTLASEFARIMVERDWAVITGAGPGIMAAGNQGAGRAASYGVNIRLPFEAESNGFIDQDKLINFKYFFTRKLGFVKESSGFALFPGGFGTMDETFELLTLIQTGKSDMHPIVMVETEGSDYWSEWDAFVRKELVGGGLITSDDLNLYKLTTDPTAAADEICSFYANYESQRYVDGSLILRIRRPPTDEQLSSLNDGYADILAEGTIQSIDPTEIEIRDSDSLDSARLAFRFDRRQFGKLRAMIDDINSWVDVTPTSRPGVPFTEEQQERPW